MSDDPTSGRRLLTPAQVAEVLGVTVDEVMQLVNSAQVRGMRVGASGVWRIEEDSVAGYLDDRVEEARLAALWQQSSEASFPELWGRGIIRHAD